LKRKLLFALVAKGLVREFVELVEQPLSGLKITDRIGSGGRSGAGLLHYCVAVVKGCDDKPTDQLEVQEGKFAIAKYLLTPRSTSVDLGLVDAQGRTVLHLAAMYGDAQLIEFLVEQRSELEKKNNTIDINCRCLNQGWTPLHYAAVSGVLSTVQLLVRLGAILNVHAFVYSPSSSGKDSDSKGPTPLELAKKKFRSSRHAPQHERHALESVIGELERALNRLEVLRQQREAEKSNKESKLREEKQRLAAKEQTERELLERKQKQLKEKQEKERIKNEEDTRRASLGSSYFSPTLLCSGLILQLASEGSGKKKKKEKKKEATAAAVTPSTPAPVVEAVVPPVAKSGPHEPSTAHKPSATPTTSSQKSSSHSSHPHHVVAGIVPVIPTPAPAANVLGDVVSRDDLLSHLLAMGFAESDCLAAISSCGLNVDMAVSWLCDPPSPSQPKSKAAEAKESKKASANRAPPAAIPSPSAQELDAQLKLQKDKEHKEEQRRINRAWNARVPHQRAEEERKKVLTALFVRP
jgi:hypothetical protein